MAKHAHVVKYGSVSIRINESVNRGKPLFFFNFHEGGQRKQRNFSTLTSARAEADNIARKLTAGHGAAISLTGRDRDAYLHAVQILKGLDVPLSIAVEEYAAARKDLGGHPLGQAVEFYLKRHPSRYPKKTVSEVRDEFIAKISQDGASKRYIDDCRHRLDRFSKAFSGLLSTIQSNEIDDWLRSLNVAPRSRNNFLGVLITLFRFAQSRGYLHKTEKTEVELISKTRQREGDIEIFSPEEMERMLNSAIPSSLPALLLGGFAGLRPAEILRLEWEDIDWDGGHIEIKATKAKTAQRRLIPIQPCLTGWLNPLAKATGQVVPFSSAQTLARSMMVAGKNCGVAWKKNALRHSYASYRLAQIQDAAKVSLEMGNSPQIIFRHYREVVKPTSAEKWFSITP